MVAAIFECFQWCRRRLRYIRDSSDRVDVVATDHVEKSSFDGRVATLVLEGVVELGLHLGLWIQVA
ncbi:MAG: hypothetical protein BGO98_29460 [Myxococcales bacterium 68-20]|nr:MAG: hypothetical protein BGO98_29460 [Myxococcales bacterium 68-20]